MCVYTCTNGQVSKQAGPCTHTSRTPSSMYVPCIKELTVQLRRVVDRHWPTILALYIPSVFTETLEWSLSVTSSKKPVLTSLQPVSPKAGQVSHTSSDSADALGYPRRSSCAREEFAEWKTERVSEYLSE